MDDILIASDDVVEQQGLPVLQRSKAMQESLTRKLQTRELCGTAPRCVVSSFVDHIIPSRRSSILASHNSRVFCGVYSEDGHQFISACQDNYVRIYDTHNWKLKEQFHSFHYSWSILDVDSSDTHIIASTWTPYLYYYRRGSGEEPTLLYLVDRDSSFGIFSSKFSPDKRCIIAGGSIAEMFLYDLESETSRMIDAHSDDINALCWLGKSNDSFLSGSDDGTIKLWDKRTKMEMPSSIFVGHLYGITCLDSMDNGTYFLSNSKDQSIKVWDIRKGTEPEKAIPPPEASWDYRSRMNPMAQVMNSGKYRHKFDTSTKTYRGHSVSTTLIRARFSPANTTGHRYIYTGSSGPHYSVFIYDVLSGKLVEQLSEHSGVVRDVSWNPNFPQIVSSGWDGDITIWDY